MRPHLSIVLQGDYSREMRGGGGQLFEGGDYLNISTKRVRLFEEGGTINRGKAITQGNTVSYIASCSGGQELTGILNSSLFCLNLPRRQAGRGFREIRRRSVILKNRFCTLLKDKSPGRQLSRHFSCELVLFKSVSKWLP